MLSLMLSREGLKFSKKNFIDIIIYLFYFYCVDFVKVSFFPYVVIFSFKVSAQEWLNLLKHSGLYNNNKNGHCLNILNCENLIKERTFIFKIKLTLKYPLKTGRLCSIFDNNELKR